MRQSVILKRTESGRRVTMIAKGPLNESSSNWAQGGIAAAVGPQDAIAAHAEDPSVHEPGAQVSHSLVPSVHDPAAQATHSVIPSVRYPA